MAQLSEGAIKKIYDTGDTTATPTLQVWDVKRIGTAATIPTLGNTLAFAGSAAGTGPSNRRPRVAWAQASRTPPPATSATGTTPRPTQAPTFAPLPSLHLPSRAMNAER